MANSLKITLLRSALGRPEKQRRTLQALGLRKVRQCRVHPDNAAIRGMVRVVEHLVGVEAFTESDEQQSG